MDQDEIIELVTRYSGMGMDELQAEVDRLIHEMENVTEATQDFERRMIECGLAAQTLDMRIAALAEAEREAAEAAEELARETAAAQREVQQAAEAAQRESERAQAQFSRDFQTIANLAGLHFGASMIRHVERFVDQSIELAQKNREEWGQASDALSEDFRRANESADGFRGTLGEIALTFEEGLAFQGLVRTTEELERQNEELTQWQRTAAGIGVIIGDWRTGFQGISQTLTRDFARTLDKDDPIRQFLENMSTEHADALEKRFSEAQGIVQQRADDKKAAANKDFDPAAEEFDAETVKEIERYQKDRQRWEDEFDRRVARVDEQMQREAERKIELEARTMQKIEDERAKLRDQAWFEELAARKKLVKEAEPKDDSFHASIVGLTDLNRRITAASASRQADPQAKAAEAAERAAKAAEEQKAIIANAFDVPLSTVKRSIDEMEVGLA